MDGTSNGASVGFRGRSYRADKLYRYGTPRSGTPQESLERIRPILKRIGITRLANVTGLDRIGIPTVIAHRPTAVIQSVAFGKGLTVEQAMVSAAMESIERYHGEKVSLPEVYLSYQQLSRQYEVIPLENLSLCKYSLFNVNRPERWVFGWDIVNQTEVAVPWELISLVSFSAPKGLASFQASSNGLAAGNHFLEAVYQALVEVIERDGIACHYEAGLAEESGYPLKRVRLESLEYPMVRQLLDQLGTARVKAVIFDCTTDIGIPVFCCYIYDQIRRHTGICKGYGANPDPEVAMVRAITEAAQSRAEGMAGMRDGFSHSEFLAARILDQEKTIQALESQPETMEPARFTTQVTPTFEGDIRLCIEKLQNVGLNQVIVFDITQPDMDITVVKVIVPGLEGVQLRYYAPGRRALAYREKARSL